MTLNDIGDYLRPRDWVVKHGGSAFPTLGSFEWFVRQHRAELVDSGALIVRRGARGSLVGPNFGCVAAEILLRKSRATSGAA